MKTHIDHIRQCLKIMRPLTAVEIAGAAAIEKDLREMEANLSPQTAPLIGELVRAGEDALQELETMSYARYATLEGNLRNALARAKKSLREMAKAKEVLG